MTGVTLRDYVNSLRSSYTGLYPQSKGSWFRGQELGCKVGTGNSPRLLSALQPRLHFLPEPPQPKLETPNPKPQNLRTENRRKKTENRNPKPETLSPKPSTLNPSS